MTRSGKTPLTSGIHRQTMTFAGAVLAQLPMISEKQAQFYIGKPDQLNKVLRDAFEEDLLSIDSWAEDRVEQEQFYREVLGMEVSLADIRIPDADGNFALPLIIHQDLGRRFNGEPIEGLFQIAKSRFGAWKNTRDSLDKEIPTNERHPINGSYAILVRDLVEADEDNQNLSAEFVRARGTLNTETILERIFHELFYYWKIGTHLDLETWTLCSGSRNSDGFVPIVGINRHEFRIFWVGRTDMRRNLRSRIVKV